MLHDNTPTTDAMALDLAADRVAMALAAAGRIETLPTELPRGWPNCGLHADDIRWEPDADSPWPASQPIIDTALRALPLIEDDLDARLIVALLQAVVEIGSQVAAQRGLLSVGLDTWNRHARAGHRLQRNREARRKARR